MTLQRMSANLILSLSTAVSALATPSAGAAEFWSDNTSITQIYPHSDGLTFYVTYTNPLSTCAGNRWIIAKTAANYEALVAGMMLAYAQDQHIQFHVYDQTPSCEPLVDRFVISR